LNGKEPFKALVQDREAVLEKVPFRARWAQALAAKIEFSLCRDTVVPSRCKLTASNQIPNIDDTAKVISNEAGMYADAGTRRS